MSNQTKPTILIVSEWRTPRGEVEVFVEGLINELASSYTIVLALRLHNRDELPLLSTRDTVLHHFRSPRELNAIINEYQPSLIHFQQCTKLALGVALNRKYVGIKLLLTLHFLPLHNVPKHSPYKPHPWSKLKRLSTLMPVVAPNPRLHETALSHGLTMSGHIIAQGVDTKRYQPGDKVASRRELGLPPDKTLVLFLGQAEDPHLVSLAHALSVLPHNLAASLVAPNASPSSAVAPVLEQLQTRGRLVPLTPIDHDDERHPLIYQAADVFVTASLPHAGQLPTMEAMASGLRIVEPAGLASALAELQTNPPLHAAFGAANRKQALALDVSHSSGAYAQIYRQLLQHQMI